MTKYTELLKKEDAGEFQKLVEQRINIVFDKLMESIELDSATNEELQVITDINDQAEELGSTDVTYKEGIMTVSFPTKDAAETFAGILDDNEYVDSYEFHVVVDGEEGDEEEVSFDEVSEEDGVEFEFIIELDSSIVNYEEMDEACKTKMNESKMLNELSFRKAVNHLGKIKKKAVCPPGTKFSNGHCVAMKSSEKQKRKMSGIKAAKARRSEMGKILKKIQKAKAFRKLKLG